MEYSVILRSAILIIHWKIKESQSQRIQHFNSSTVCTNCTINLICCVATLSERWLSLYKCLSEVPLLKLSTFNTTAFPKTRLNLTRIRYHQMSQSSIKPYLCPCKPQTCIFQLVFTLPLVVCHNSSQFKSPQVLSFFMLSSPPLRHHFTVGLSL